MQPQETSARSVEMQHQFQSTQSNLLTLPRELRDQIIDYVLHGFASLEVACINLESATSIGNSLLLTCQQLRSESLQRIRSLRLDPTLEVLQTACTTYHTAWTIPPVPSSEGKVQKRTYIHFPYPILHSYDSVDFYLARHEEACCIAAIFMDALSHPVEELHVNLSFREASDNRLPSYKTILNAHDKTLCDLLDTKWTVKGPGWSHSVWPQPRNKRIPDAWEGLKTVALTVFGE